MRTIRRKEQEETDISQTEGVVEAAPFFIEAAGQETPASTQ